MSTIVFWIIVVVMLVGCFVLLIVGFGMAMGAGLSAAIGSNQERAK